MTRTRYISRRHRGQGLQSADMGLLLSPASGASCRRSCEISRHCDEGASGKGGAEGPLLPACTARPSLSVVPLRSAARATRQTRSRSARTRIPADVSATGWRASTGRPKRRGRLAVPGSEPSRARSGRRGMSRASRKVHGCGCWESLLRKSTQGACSNRESRDEMEAREGSTESSSCSSPSRGVARIIRCCSALLLFI